MRIPPFFAASLLGIAFLLTSAAAAGRATSAEQPAVSDFKLDNDLEIVFIPDRRAPVVTHMLWYRVGGADEELGKSGIAHFFEHLMFKGTKNYPAGEFSRKVAEIGGRENAFTSNDYTVYFQKVSPQALEMVMTYEADRMRNLILTDDVIGPERDVVLEERRSRVEADPGSLLGEEVDATLYHNHTYGIPVIGWKHEIRRLNRADAIAFYDRFCSPENAVLVVVGDVEPVNVLTLARKTYGIIPRGSRVPARARPQETEHSTSGTVTMKDARVSVPSMRRVWLAPSYNSDRPGEAEALDLLSEILGGRPRGWLYRELVVRRGIAGTAEAYYLGTTVDDTAFGVYGSPRGTATLQEVEKAILSEIKKLAAEGVTEKELEKAKNRFVKSTIFASDSQSGMARIFGSTLATGGTVADVLDWPGRIRAVTAETIQRVAKKYLNDRRSVTGYLLPEENNGG